MNKADNDTNDEASVPSKKQKIETHDGKPYHVLILGASYGSLLSTKLLLAGHNVTLVCREATAAIFNEQGSVVRLPIRGRDGLVEIRSKSLEGELRASPPDTLLTSSDGSTTGYDLVVLAMQEPQYSAPGVRELVGRIAAAKIPTMAITNMPILPYLQRISALEKLVVTDGGIRSCFAEASLWDGFDYSLLTQCSPDPQAFRPPSESPNVLQVRLPTNFKAARFANDEHTHMLRRLEREIEAIRYDTKDGTTDDEPSALPLPVKLRVYDSLFVPFSKWAMLLAGNYSCIRPYPQEMVSIKEAVCGDVQGSQKVYEWVVSVCVGLGGSQDDFVPFEKYQTAAMSLESPSSAARSLQSGATNIERIDKLVASLALTQGQRLEAVDKIVARVDEWLGHNKQKSDQKDGGSG